jgi:hypothetical protein
MSKKSRKVRSKTRVAQPVGRPDASQSQQSVASVVRGRERQPASAAALVPVNYDYVKSDLARIGIIAGVLILVIIVLTFIPAMR